MKMTILKSTLTVARRKFIGRYRKAHQLTVMPGSSRFLLLSPGGSGAWDRLKQRFGLQASQ